LKLQTIIGVRCSISSLLSFCLTGTHTPNSKHKNIKHWHQRGKVLYHLGLLFFDILDSEVQLLATPPLHPSLCDIGNWACATLGVKLTRPLLAAHKTQTMPVSLDIFQYELEE